MLGDPLSDPQHCRVDSGSLNLSATPRHFGFDKKGSVLLDPANLRGDRLPERCQHSLQPYQRLRLCLGKRNHLVQPLEG